MSSGRCPLCSNQLQGFMACPRDNDRILEKGRVGEYVGLRIHPRQPIRLDRIGGHDVGLLVSVSGDRYCPNFTGATTLRNREHTVC